MPREHDRAEGIATLVWSATAVLGIAGMIATLAVWGRQRPGDSIPNLASGVGGIVYATLGALIVRRARNLIGWILLGVGFGFALLSITSAYAVVGLAAHPGSLPGADVAGTLAQVAFVVSLPLLAFMLLFFPTGALPSRRWRWVVVVGVAALALTAVGFLFQPISYGVPAPNGSIRFPNPLGIESLPGPISTMLVGTVWVVVLVIGAAFLALILRFRRGSPEERQQIKWVAFVTAIALLCNVVAIGSLVACHCDSSPVASAFQLAVPALVLLGMPAALTIAILKYRLYDIDVIINRTVVYGSLAVAFTLVYGGVVVGVGTIIGRRGSPLLTIVAAVAIALLFQPLRQRARRLANRVVYGERATPYQVLSDFAERMAGTYGLEDVLQRMASILASGTGATKVDVWLRVGPELRRVASWPVDPSPVEPVALGSDEELPAFADATRATPVRHDDELLGALVLVKPPNEPLSPTEEKLLRDLAAQAGLILRNVRLTAELQANNDELRASRRRLVRAQDEERRKIERNLHDGAQQQLVALSVRVGLLERLAEDPERVREVATQLQGGLHDALDELRDLARGIYPPLLADKGLATALDAQARKAATATIVDANGLGRYPRDVEAAVYFCTLEAMQNVAKYAGASAAIVRLSEGRDRLIFEIQDDGRGFDPATMIRGSGIQGMADRLDAIGGVLEIESAPGRGTLVRGAIPVGAPLP